MKLKKKKKKTVDTILQSVSIFFTFLYPCLHVYLLCFSTPYFNVWSGYFYVLLNLLAVPALLILINCPHDTAFLHSVLFWRCWGLQGAGAAEPHWTFFFSLPVPNISLVISLFYNPWKVRAETSCWGFANFRMRVKLTKFLLVRNIQISSEQIALKSKRLSVRT